jgi:adenylate cyclase
VLRALWNYYNVRAEFQTSFGIAEELLQLAQQQQKARYLIGAHRALGSDLFFAGEFNKSLFLQDKVIALYEPKGHKGLAFIYWTDPKVHSLSFIAVILWVLGFPDQALQKSQKALALAHESSHAYTLAVALFMGLWPHFFLRDICATQKQAEKLMKFSTEKGFPLWVGGGSFSEVGPWQWGNRKRMQSIKCARQPLIC